MHEQNLEIGPDVAEEEQTRAFATSGVAAGAHLALG
jgi:hypothetical protein